MTEITDAELDEWERLRAEFPLLKVSRLIKDLRACRQRNEKNEERILRLRHLNTRYRQRANALEAAPETAAERDRLKAINAELLVTLERTLNWLASYPGGGAKETYDEVRAAIAKAQGDQ
ncbi:hypothetical protein LCGC14_1905550 [marine sediment metagenome]|uniref:Uncharacterized protein n=1 Tax=marine sediment metagenome TaxID=412755 RepID=A0A0F9GIM2_9ZZZZ